MIYGAIGMLSFMPGFLADRRLGIKLAKGYSTVSGIVSAWTAGIVLSAIACSVFGSIARPVDSQKPPD